MPVSSFLTMRPYPWTWIWKVLLDRAPHGDLMQAFFPPRILLTFQSPLCEKVWKLTLGGEIISYVEYERKLSTLTQRISQPHNIYTTNPFPVIYKKHLSLQVECDILMSQHSTELVLCTRFTYFEHGDKASKLLAHHQYQALYLISMDAVKSFDIIEWNYLFYTFWFWGKIIKLLYSSLQDSVRTNNIRSEYFHLYRSVRQGCPLNPNLFAICSSHCPPSL